jgi:hypothetical protein
MAKINNLPAESYAKPHTMSGGSVDLKSVLGVKEDPNNLPANKMTLRTGVPRVSAGDPHAEDIKTDGIEVRGRSKQTKGKLARGPMY